MIVRDATRADYQRFYAKEPHVTLRGLVAESSLGIVGFGGYYMNDGYAVVFTDQRAMRKRDMVKAAHMLMDRVKELGVETIATPGPEGDTAMLHFGFVPWGSAYRLAR